MPNTSPKTATVAAWPLIFLVDDAGAVAKNVTFPLEYLHPL